MKAFRDWSLRTKVLIVAAVSIVLGFGVMIAIIASQMYASSEEQGLARAREQAEAYAQKVSADFAWGYQLPKHLALAVQGMQGKDFPERKTLDAMLIRMLQSVPQASGLWMLWEPNAMDGKDADYAKDWPVHDPTGRYMPYITRADNQIKQDTMLGADQQKAAEKFRENPEGYKPAYESSGWGDFYFVPKQRGRDTVTEPFPYDVQGKQVLMSSLVVAMKDGAGKFLGVSAIDVPLANLQESVGKYKPFGVGYVTLISNGGQYVVARDPKLLGKPVEPQAFDAGLLDAVKSGKPMQFEKDGYVHIFTPIAVGDTGEPWSIGVSVPQSVIVAEAVAVRNRAVLVGVVMTLVIIGLLALFLTALMRPLLRLSTAMEALAAGQGDLTRRLEVRAEDEIGRTAAHFNRFMGSLRDMFVDVRSQSEAVGGSAEQLAGSAHCVEAASAQQAEAATATAASVEQVTVSIQHIAETARDFEHTARATGTETANSQQLVTGVAHEIQLINDRVAKLSETMDSLGQQSEQVNTIVRVIKDIAEQTNLLALNAAIEAARAGEQGRGFAVVADEVRKLAARTAEATVEISRIVETIQTEIGTAASDMGAARSQIESGRELSQRAARSMDSVRDSTQHLVTSIVQIAEATSEQAAASTDIAQNIEKISTMSQNNSQAVDEVGKAVEQLEQLSSNLRGIVGRFKI
ncbi:methyl-accepting chemotaxis protein [Chitinivorax sp. PXF-14]|uniref:methyl-accepting chemotaxis protein n=1 Tax=Chitinivorax sp. PXF-14 TaxID=3230488 RepID=UPI003467D261